MVLLLEVVLAIECGDFRHLRQSGTCSLLSWGVGLVIRADPFAILGQVAIFKDRVIVLRGLDEIANVRLLCPCLAALLGLRVLLTDLDLRVALALNASLAKVLLIYLQWTLGPLCLHFIQGLALSRNSGGSFSLAITSKLYSCFNFRL